MSSYELNPPKKGCEFGGALRMNLRVADLRSQHQILVRIPLPIFQFWCGDDCFSKDLTLKWCKNRPRGGSKGVIPCSCNLALGGASWYLCVPGLSASTALQEWGLARGCSPHLRGVDSPQHQKRHLGSLTAANWVSFDFNVSYSSC